MCSQLLALLAGVKPFHRSLSGLQVMPMGIEMSAVENPSEVPELDLNGWFWLAVSESVRGQAVMALVKESAQVGMAALGEIYTIIVCYHMGGVVWHVSQSGGVLNDASVQLLPMALVAMLLCSFSDASPPSAGTNVSPLSSPCFPIYALSVHGLSPCFYVPLCRTWCVS